MSERFQFTIYRDSWLHAINPDDFLDKSMLLREDNKMCCLGQILFQEGVALSCLLQVPSPAAFVRRIARELPGSLKGFAKYDPSEMYCAASTPLANTVMEINDTIAFKSEEEHERAVKEVLAQVNIDVTFVDGVAPWFQGAASV